MPLKINYTTYMHENHPSDKADTLAVARVIVGHRIGMEHSPESGLTALLQGAVKVRVGGECTTCVVYEWE